MINNYGVNQLFENAVRMVLVQRRKLRFWNSQLRQVLKPQAQKPYLLPKPSLPDILIETSTYWSDMKSNLSNSDYADVQFIVRGTVVDAHSIILCAAWPRFHEFISASIVTNTCDTTKVNDNGNVVIGLNFIDFKADNRPESQSNKKIPAGNVVVEVDQRITLRAFLKILEYLYSCQFDEPLEPDILIELLTASDILSLERLQLILANIFDRKNYKNASIINDAKQKFIGRIKMLCTSQHFQVGFATDATFEANNAIIPINRIIVTSRCDVIAAMFNGGFLESGLQHVSFMYYTVSTIYV